MTRETTALTIPYVELTPVSMELPPVLSESQWEEIGVVLSRIEGGVQWWIGDWWAYGEHEYGARKEWAEAQQYEYGTYKNYGWVSDSVGGSTRVDLLSWAHHRLVAKFSEPVQKKWLKKALRGEPVGDNGKRRPWTRRELRAAIKAEEYLLKQKAIPAAGEAIAYHQDALEFLGTIAEGSADLLFTDPPYMTDVSDIAAFAREWLPLALSRIKATGRAYIFTGAYPIELHAYLDVLKDELRLSVGNVLVWTYRNTLGPSPSHDYKLNWQACFYLYGPEAPPLDAPEMLEQFSVQDINAPDGRLGDRIHTWQKPDELAERFIRHATVPGALVIDPFCGTGAFLHAAKRLGRSAIGCDTDQAMLELCRRRGVDVA